MKNAGALSSTLLSVLLFASFMVGCSDSNKSVQLRDSAPAPAPGSENNPGEKPGTEPAPAPTPEAPGEEPIPGPIPGEPGLGSNRVARFICETQKVESRSFNTMRGDAISNFQMPSIVPYFNGKPFTWVKSAIPLQSNGNTVFFVMRGQMDPFSPWKIYKATGRLLDSAANVEVLSNYPGLPSKGGYAYENLNMGRDVLSANVKRTAYLYPANDGTYTWENLKGSKLTVPFKANRSFNPTFIGSDDYLRFDQEGSSSGAITQKFYHFDSKKTISLPSPAESRDSQVFGYIDVSKKNLFWVEGRPESSWKVRMSSLSNPSKGVTIGTLPGEASAIRLPMTFMDRGGETILAYAEELRGTDQTGRVFLKSAAIHLVKVSATQAKITSEKAISYSDEIKNSAAMEAVVRSGILAGLFLEPLSGRLYAINLPNGGLVSFDLNGNFWRVHGGVSISYGCYNPQWGVEVTNE